MFEMSRISIFFAQVPVHYYSLLYLDFLLILLSFCLKPLQISDRYMHSRMLTNKIKI